nr:MAG TPA: hypothetical protein [Caudoviricetes sp.]
MGIHSNIFSSYHLRKNLSVEWRWKKNKKNESN